MQESYVNCQLCPRRCGVNRSAGERGFCGCPDTALVAKAMLHKWEEPALAGNGGSGAIFFGGCSLGCSYCQNRAISGKATGEAMDSLQLRALMEKLIDQGAENIDLVTAGQYLPTILPALEEALPVPVIYNCGGYETKESIQALKGKIDIYLPDMKYGNNSLGAELSGVKDYFDVATGAIEEMVKQIGSPQWQGDKLMRGVVIRHLILPGHIENSLKVLDWIGGNFSSGEVLVSLMRQYTPMPNMKPPLDRRVTQEEYEAVLSWMYLNNLQGFGQDALSADAVFIPDF